MNAKHNTPETIATMLDDADIIDFNSPIPFYYQLQQCLEAKISAGEWAAGQKLPSEKKLGDHFGVSRTVIRQALNELASKSLIETQKGRGSFVSAPKHAWQLMQSLSGFNENAIARGQTIQTQVLALKLVPAAGEVAASLQLNVGEPVTMLKRLRFVDGEPLVVVTTYIPEKICPDLVNEDFTNASLYELLATKHNLAIAEGVRTIESVNATPDLAQLLQIKEGAALSLLTSIGWLANGTPLEYYVAWHRGDRSRFQVRLVANS
ncbi:MAG: GntR family transcriptional regulator [Anaerolineales bacterium]|nr:GntR family transcriptional regulator [Anaerolineales bacterium]